MVDTGGDTSGDDPEGTDEATDGGRVFVSKSARNDALVRTLALGVAVASLSGVLMWAAPGLADPEWVRTEIAALGTLAPVAFVALQAAQVVLAPVPGQVVGGVGGFLFGTVAGTVLSMVGVVMGSTVVFVASTRYGRPYVEGVVDADALARWDGFVERRGAAGLFVLFLLPTFPDDLLCFVAGLSEIRPRTFLALVVVGRTPTFIAASYAGTRLADGRLVTFAGVALVLAAVSALVYLGRERVLDALEDVA